MSAEQTTRKRAAVELFAPLPRHYDKVAAALSFGQDPRWRSAIVEQIAANPTHRVLDVATGTGMVAEALVRRWGCEVVALDQSEQMLERARARVRGNPVLGRRITLVRGEAERLPFPAESFDHLTFTYLLRYVDDAAATMRELARVVRPGGRIAAVEFGVPDKRHWRFLWSLYTRVGLPALGRLVSPEWAATGRFLSRSIPELYERHPPSELVEMWRAAGIGSVRTRAMSFGGGIVTYGVRELPSRGDPSDVSGDGARSERSGDGARGARSELSGPCEPSGRSSGDGGP